MANYNSSTVSILKGNGDGTFQTHVDYPTGSNPRSITAVDLNGDHKLDLVTGSNNGGNDVSVLLNSGAALGSGTAFAAAVNYADGGSSIYQVVATDVNGDGKMDLITASYGSSRIGVFYGNGDGTLSAVTSYTFGGNPISVAVGDYNGDGRSDLAIAPYPNNSSGNQVAILTGDPTLPLIEDPVGSGLRSGFGRGNLSSTSDVDYWSFTANAGDTLTLASEIPGTPGSSQLYFEVDGPTGTALASFYGDGNGRNGQTSPVVLPTSGTYRVRVSYNNDYESEYRIRVTLAAAGTQMESETNDAIGSANVPTLALVTVNSIVHQQAKIAGYLNLIDGGDVYKLGNLTAGTTITLGETQPSTSGLSDILAVLNSGYRGRDLDCGCLFVQLHDPHRW